jgi:type VI protein secretion system component Hcp
VVLRISDASAEARGRRLFVAEPQTRDRDQHAAVGGVDHAAPSESISLAFETVHWEFANGNATAPPTTLAGWDITTNAAA